MRWSRRHDVGGAAIAALLLAFALVSWNLAARYRHTFRLKRAAAPLKYDDSVIHYLQHGHAVALTMLIVVATVVVARVVLGRRGRGAKPPAG